MNALETKCIVSKRRGPIIIEKVESKASLLIK